MYIKNLIRYTEEAVKNLTVNQGRIYRKADFQYDKQIFLRSLPTSLMDHLRSSLNCKCLKV